MTNEKKNPMKCSACPRIATRLRWRSGGKGFLCETCYSEDPSGVRKTMLHQSANNRWSPKMTAAKRAWLASHSRHSDGTVRPRRGL